MTADTAPDLTQHAGELTDGFHLVIDALRLNGIETLYHVPGIPVTDLGRFAQAAGMRVISFRHEQNAGYAASIAGFSTSSSSLKPAETSLTARLPVMESASSGPPSPRSREMTRLFVDRARFVRFEWVLHSVW